MLVRKRFHGRWYSGGGSGDKGRDRLEEAVADEESVGLDELRGGARHEAESRLTGRVLLKWEKGSFLPEVELDRVPASLTQLTAQGRGQKKAKWATARSALGGSGCPARRRPEVWQVQPKEGGQGRGHGGGS